MAQPYNPNAADASLSAPPSNDLSSQVINWLGSLYTQAQNANTGASADTTQNTPQLPPAHQAAVDGAIQGIKKAASEAATTGGLDAANHIINLATSSGIGNNLGGSQPTPLDMNSLTAPSQQAPALQAPATQQSSTAISGQSNPVIDFLTKLGFAQTPSNQLLLSQVALNKQKSAAGNPSEVALPQAQADLLNQKIQGKEPLQASDYANIVGGMNTLNLDALKTASQKMEDDLKERQSEIDTSQKTINMFGRLGGLFSGNGQTITSATQAAQKEINRLKIAKATIDSQIATFKPRNPVTNKINMEAPGTATHYSPSTGKYYDAQGQEIN